ncbi:MAG TPA: PilZ domain-containing protein [Mobilitalea sp.]|nr:PilZ domain-containing protein [Mobilitalea sp.]
MLREVLTLGDKIDIKPLDKAGKPLRNARTYVSQLLDFADFDIINISAPIVYGRAIIFNAGENYNLCFYTNIGLFQCNCVVLSNHKENNAMVCVVRITTNLEKYQRRQYYRLECLLDIEYRVIRKEEEMIEQKIHSNDFRSNQEKEDCFKLMALFEKEWVKATVMDISGGGARYNSPVQYNQGDKLRIKLDLAMRSEIKRLVLSAIMVTSIRVTNRYDSYENRIEFTDIPQRDREELIKFIFEQDRKRRKNEK